MKKAILAVAKVICNPDTAGGSGVSPADASRLLRLIADGNKVAEELAITLAEQNRTLTPAEKVELDNQEKEPEMEERADAEAESSRPAEAAPKKKESKKKEPKKADDSE